MSFSYMYRRILVHIVYKVYYFIRFCCRYFFSRTFNPPESHWSNFWMSECKVIDFVKYFQYFIYWQKIIVYNIYLVCQQLNKSHIKVKVIWFHNLLCVYFFFFESFLVFLCLWIQTNFDSFFILWINPRYKSRNRNTVIKHPKNNIREIQYFIAHNIYLLPTAHLSLYYNIILYGQCRYIQYNNIRWTVVLPTLCSL